MLKATTIILSLSAALQLVLASSITLTDPAPNSHVKAGSSIDIKWTVEDAANVGTIHLQYASGSAQSLAINGIIAENVDASLGKYTWLVPEDIKQTKIVIEAGPNNNDLSFAGYINIQKTTATTPKKPAKKPTPKKPTPKKHTPKKHTTKKSAKKHSSAKKSAPKTVCLATDNGDFKCHSEPKVKKAAKKSTQHKTTTHHKKATHHKKTSSK